MRKATLAAALMALFLAACNSATPTNTAPQSAADTTSATGATSTEATAAPTDAPTEASTEAPTAETTSATETTPTAEAVAATDAVTGTEGAAVTGTTNVTDSMAMTGTMAMTDTMVAGGTAVTDTATTTGTMSMTGTVPVTSTMAMTQSPPMTRTVAFTDAASITATSATAELRDADGNIVGEAVFSDTSSGVNISITVSGLVTATAGEHGIHFHRVGTCTPDFAAAGEHFNPTMAKHGSENPRGPHAGDLPNIVFDGEGNAAYTTTATLVEISGPQSLLAADGTSILIHANPDDYVTDPAGRSGARIACGVLRAEGVEAPVVSSGPPPPPGGTLNQPEHLSATADRIAGLRVPDGFAISVFAEDLGNARIMARHEDGAIYVTRRMQGDVIALRDENDDGAAEPFIVATTGLTMVHGIIITGDQVYLGALTTIYRGEIEPDGTISGLEPFVTNLPDPGQHPNIMMAFGPDGNMYVSIGSTCNACNEPNPENAAILQVSPDGKSRTIYADGLRNTIGWGWHPASGELWGMDHGSDWRGDEQPPEELNRIEQGNNYGWPHCFADKQVDRYLSVPPPNLTKAEFCAASTAPVLTYEAHSAPLAMAFYPSTSAVTDMADVSGTAGMTGTAQMTDTTSAAAVTSTPGVTGTAAITGAGGLTDTASAASTSGVTVTASITGTADVTGTNGVTSTTGASFPTEYGDGAFVAMRGSWNRSQPVGYKVVHIRFEDDEPVEINDFLTGFLVEGGAGQFGRPVGLLVLPDGSLLVGDDTNGMIYRIAYEGQ